MVNFLSSLKMGFVMFAAFAAFLSGCDPTESWAVDGGMPVLGEPCVSADCDRAGNCKMGHQTMDGRCCTGCTDEHGDCRDGLADATHCGSAGELCVGCLPDWCGAPACVSSTCGFDPYPQGSACGDSDDPKFYCNADSKCCTPDQALCY